MVSTKYVSLAVNVVGALAWFALGTINLKNGNNGLAFLEYACSVTTAVSAAANIHDVVKIKYEGGIK